jgi:hypothetical protein
MASTHEDIQCKAGGKREDSSHAVWVAASDHAAEVAGEAHVAGVVGVDRGESVTHEVEIGVGIHKSEHHKGSVVLGCEELS